MISEFIISSWKKLNKFCDIAKLFFDNIHVSAYPIFSSQEIEHSLYQQVDTHLIHLRLH